MRGWIAALCAAGFFLGLLPGRANDDFLFIIADDQSATRFWSSVRPNPTAALEALADGATIFNQAYCPGAVCNASRAAMLSCQPPYLTGIFDNTDDPRGLPSVLHYLKTQGYQLRASGKIFHTGYEQNGVFVRVADPKPKGGTDVELKKKGSGTPLQIGVNEVKAPSDGDALKADLTIRSIRKSNPVDRNGFLIGFTATHLPFFVPNSRRYAKAFSRKKTRLPVATWATRPPYARERNRKYRIPAGKRKEVIARYNGCLRYASDQAARVIRAFQGKFPDGHVIFVSDHGFLLDEGRSWGKPSTMEVSCRVPYFVWSNQLPAGRVEGPVSTGTAFPLLLDLCGLPPFESAHWESPRQWIEDGQTPEGHLVYTYSGRRAWLRATRGEEVFHFKDENVYKSTLDDLPLE